jgi:hypothetical protein
MLADAAIAKAQGYYRHCHNEHNRDRFHVYPLQLIIIKASKSI